MTSEEMIEVYLNLFGCSKSNSATAKVALMKVLKRQRKMCADEVKREGYRKNHVPTIQDYVKACLNATGERND